MFGPLIIDEGPSLSRTDRLYAALKKKEGKENAKNLLLIFGVLSNAKIFVLYIFFSKHPQIMLMPHGPTSHLGVDVTQSQLSLDFQMG